MTYTTGEVEALTGIKQHVLRYWEENIPGFTPRKDFTGRRCYSLREVELIFRLKHLVYEKKFTVEGAGKQLIEDAVTISRSGETLRLIRELRKELTDLYMAVKGKNQPRKE